jgi:hypothetical protein
MRRPFVLAILLAAAGGHARAEGGTGVLLYRQAELGRACDALFDALRVYLRDLGRSVVQVGDPPRSEEPDEILRAATELRRREAELALWFGGEPGHLMLYALPASSLDLRVTAVEAGAPERIARTLALQVRALLTRGAVADEDAWVSVLKQPPPVRKAPEPSEASSRPPPGPAPPPAAPQPTVAARAASPPRAWFEMAAAYAVDVPVESTWLRHGVALRAQLLPPRWPLFAALDVTIGSRPSALVGATRVSLSDVPIGVSGGARWRSGRFALLGGPRLALHLVQADAVAADGRNGAATTVSAGVGAAGQGVFYLSDHVGVHLTLYGEVLLPLWREFAFPDGTARLGPLAFGAAVGLLFAGP